MTRDEIAEDIAETIEANDNCGMEAARAKVRTFEAAVLRELAHELRGGPDVTSTADGYGFEEKAYNDISAALTAKADALEAGKP